LVLFGVLLPLFICFCALSYYLRVRAIIDVPPPPHFPSPPLRLYARLADHDWENEPLVVDLSAEGREVSGQVSVLLRIVDQFRSVRAAPSANASAAAAEGESGDSASGPSAALRRRMNVPMYVVSSADKAHGYWPSLAPLSPEKVVLDLIVRLAGVSARRLLVWMQQSRVSEEAGAVQEVMADRAVLAKCDVLLKFNAALRNKDPEAGPAFARLEVFANTPASDAAVSALVVR
jgi:hypothetical protein